MRSNYRLSGEGTYLVDRIRGGKLLAGLAAAQLAGEDFLAGLDRQRADAAGQQLAPVPGLSSTTAAGLARRMTAGQWRSVGAGLAAVTGRMLELLPAPRAAALTEGPVTIDLDATDVEVYGSRKRGVAYNHLGQRMGRPHVAAWAETEVVLAGWLHQLTAVTRGETLLAGHGVRGGKAMIATLRRRLIAVPGRLTRHAGQLVLRLPPGHGLLAEILARLRALPAMS